jgi:hypothetical protein
LTPRHAAAYSPSPLEQAADRAGDGTHARGRSPRHAEQSLSRLATRATNHCLTGCLIGEVTGMTIATALGWGDVASIALAVGLAFLFGYSLTSVPLTVSAHRVMALCRAANRQRPGS